MRRYTAFAGAGLACCALACSALAVALPGGYTYKLVLRDDHGFALCGTMADDGDESVSANYAVEVYDANGVKVNATLKDTVIGRECGHNCTLSVLVGEGAGYAKAGERLTLVVTAKYDGTERFRSSKVLPPVGGTFGFAGASAGAFYADADDTDNGWDVWLGKVEGVLGASIGGSGDDYDNDGLSNMREYQLGTDPAGDALGGPQDGPGFTIEEQGGAYKVTFNYSWKHVYSVRMVEGTAAVGVDGQDLKLYENLESIDSALSWGTYFYDDDYNTGTAEFFVKKPEIEGAYLIGLAVDGRLQEYIKVGSESVEVSPGYPLECESEEKATAAKATAAVVPTEAVAAVLTGDGMVDAYKAKFTVEAVQKDDKWFLSAELTPEAWTNLMENANAATRQIPVAGISQLPPEATTNVVVTGCTPGFYYSLNSGAAVKNIPPDAEAENLGVLCGADGVVEFPKVSKPSEAAGFYKVVTNVR